ncbi:MAG TPA: single-stranded DNA-binding protein [Polyangiales bacterium]|nr:single-stranded DNA-binding protein [Polyangiales bacterium]
MAEGLNRVILIGNLGQDPELRFTQSNQGVLSLRMATTESYFDTNTKERKEITEWHTVVVWGKRGEALNKILSKGSRIAVEGRLKTRSWDDKNGGGKRYATDVVANNVILLGGRGEGGGSSRSAGGGDFAGHDDHSYGNGDSPADDDIPFALNESTMLLSELAMGAGRRLI